MSIAWIHWSYYPKLGGGILSLATAFKSAKNLGALTEAWIQFVKVELKARQAETTVMLQLDSAASMVAPAALVASIVSMANLSVPGRPVRVLLIGSDPLIRFDKSAWASLAGELLGVPGSVEIFLTADEDVKSDFSHLAKTLELKSCRVLCHEDAREGRGEMVDLAIWLHPANESSDPIESENKVTALALAKTHSVPTYSGSFNEVDVHAQNYLLHDDGMQIVPFGGAVQRGSPAINRYGISTAGVGVEGGWAAILGRLNQSTPFLEAKHISVVRTAMRLVCAEGAIHSSWSLGQRINGVAFNRIIPLGLLGNMAVDPQTGHLFRQDEDSNELRLIGHLWADELKTMPVGKNDLLLWASGLKLAFQSDLPKEDARRKEAIQVLEEGLAAGVLPAGIALARCYEASKAEGSNEKASALYASVGDRHPLSSYSLAYEAIERDDESAAERHLRTAAGFGYPVAMTDLGKLLYSTGRTQEGVQLLESAARAKEAEANYELGELSARGGHLQPALEYFRQAWTYGHTEAAKLAAEVAQYMLAQSIGKRSLIKRELKEISACLTKLDRRLAANVPK